MKPTRLLRNYFLMLTYLTSVSFWTRQLTHAEERVFPLDTIRRWLGLNRVGARQYAARVQQDLADALPAA
jgi:hypothetical protein